MRLFIEINDKSPKNLGGRPKGSTDKTPRAPRANRSADVTLGMTQTDAMMAARQKRKAQAAQREADALALTEADAREIESKRQQERERAYAARREAARLAIKQVRATDAETQARAAEHKLTGRTDAIAASPIEGSNVL